MVGRQLSSNILYLECVHQAERQVTVQLVVKIETKKGERLSFQLYLPNSPQYDLNKFGIGIHSFKISACLSPCYQPSLCLTGTEIPSLMKRADLRVRNKAPGAGGQEGVP